MTGQADHIEVPLSLGGQRVVLRAERSEYGDYFDFYLLVRQPDPLEIRASLRTEWTSIAHVSGYACKTQLIVMEGIGPDDEPFGSATLIVGNATLCASFEHAQALASFLGVELERK